MLLGQGKFIHAPQPASVHSAAGHPRSVGPGCAPAATSCSVIVELISVPEVTRQGCGFFLARARAHGASSLPTAGQPSHLHERGAKLGKGLNRASIGRGHAVSRYLAPTPRQHLADCLDQGWQLGATSGTMHGGTHMPPDPLYRRPYTLPSRQAGLVYLLHETSHQLLS